MWRYGAVSPALGYLFVSMYDYCVCELLRLMGRLMGIPYVEVWSCFSCFGLSVCQHVWLLCLWTVKADGHSLYGGMGLFLLLWAICLSACMCFWTVKADGHLLCGGMGLFLLLWAVCQHVWLLCLWTVKADGYSLCGRMGLFLLLWAICLSACMCLWTVKADGHLLCGSMGLFLLLWAICLSACMIIVFVTC